MSICRRRTKAPGRELLERRFPELRGKRWLLFLGRLDPKKGLDLLLDVWRELEPRHPGWHLVIAPVRTSRATA
ncbi:MAG: glycosyltransferase [Thermoanaerobaculia bacterium]